MDLLTFLTQTLEGKTISVIGVVVIAFMLIGFLIYRYFNAQKDSTDIIKSAINNQADLVSTIRTQTEVNQSIASQINASTSVLDRYGTIMDKLTENVSAGTAISSSIREQLALDRTLIEAKLSSIPEEVSKAITSLFETHNTAYDQNLLIDIRKYIQAEGSKFRVGVMTISGTGDILFANNDVLDLIGADNSIVGKNVIKDDVLRMVDWDGTPLISEASPFYSALSNGVSVNATVGIFNVIRDNFAWFMLRVNPTFSSADSGTRFMVTLTDVGSIVKAQSSSGNAMSSISHVF